MARPRTPKAKATITGQAAVRRKKFEERTEPKVAEGVGEPFDWLSENAKKAWRELVAEIPWLNMSHRGVLSIAAKLRGRMMGDSSNGETDLGIQGMNLYQVCLGKMGATPADASKAGVKPDGEGDEDPAAKYFT
jgi:broad specificity phosphatase PhoE